MEPCLSLSRDVSFSVHPSVCLLVSVSLFLSDSLLHSFFLSLSLVFFFIVLSLNYGLHVDGTRKDGF